MVARCLYKWKNAKVFRNNRFILHSHSQRFFANVSVKILNINSRRVTSAHVVTLLSFMQLIEEYLLAIKRILIIPDPKDINGQLPQKSMASCRRNERFQRPKTSWFDFVFPFAFKNIHRFENVFSFIMEGIGTLWLFEFGLSHNYLDVTAIIELQRFDFLIECKLNDGTCQFYFSHNENIQFST